MTERPARLYVITPAPSSEGRSAIVEALERVVVEDDAPSDWADHARREAVDDGLD